MSVDICASLISHLYNNDVVRGLVGDAIYRDIAPSTSKVTLYIVVQRLAARSERHLTATSGYAEALIQINTWGSNRTTVEAVADAIREAVDHMTHATLGTPPNEAEIGVIHLDRNPDAVTPARSGEENVVYGARQTARIFHDESVPTFA